MIKKNSSLKLNNILNNIYIIEKEKDYCKYIKTSNRTFKVLGELTNTIINPDVVKDMDLLFFKDNKNLEKIIFLDDGIISVPGNMKLKFLCIELLKKHYDCSFLIGIPGTIASAVVNNTGLGRGLGESILTNVIKVEYYKKDKKYIKKIDDILYSYRNTEFKFTNNIFISRVYFSFTKISKAQLLKNIKKRYLDRTKLYEIYKKPSLGTFYIRNNFLKYKNVISKDISINNNKIINYGEKTSYNDYLNLKKQINPLYEIEIEEINKFYKDDYVGLLIIDKKNNILLQKYDNKISLFGGTIKNNEGIKEDLIRKIKEELDFNIDNLIYSGLFIENYDFCIKRYFIFKIYVGDLYDFIKNINYKREKILIKNFNNIKDIVENNIYTYILKKALIYNLSIIK